MAERTSLTGVSISDGYPQILHVSDTLGLTAVSTQLYDANGTALPAWASTAEMRFGGANDYAEIQADGDVFFVGGGGLAFGHMFLNSQTTVTIGDNNPTEIPEGFTSGNVHNMTFGDAHHIVAPTEGFYYADWSLSFMLASSSGIPAIHAGIMIGGSALSNDAEAHGNVRNANDSIAISATTIVDLAADAQVSLYIENATNTEDIILVHGNLSLVHIGGT